MPSTRFKPETVEAAVEHLSDVDPVLRDLIRQVGPFRLKLERDRFRMLVRSIVSQQLSTKAARTIRQRLDALVAPQKPTVENLSQLSIEELRSAGLSGQKAAYVQDLCEKVQNGRLPLRRIGRLSDEDVIRTLTQVKGIGRWSAQMFLMFSLGRPDVFPHDDLGIRGALRDLYGLDALPDKQTSLRIAEPWSPYSTIACWYCWRSGELTDDGNRDGPDYTEYPV